MYCPKCGTQIAESAARCDQCDFDVQPIARMLAYGEHVAEPLSEPNPSAARAKRWKNQRHSLGLLLIMCSLLVGCFIPLAIGLLNGVIALGPLITGLAGFAGVLLMLGTMLIMAAEGTILASNNADQSSAEPHAAASPHTLESASTSDWRHEEPARRPARR